MSRFVRITASSLAIVSSSLSAFAQPPSTGDAGSSSPSSTSAISISGAAPSKSSAFNPAIGANFLGLIQHGTAFSDDPAGSPRNGISLQEAEIMFAADVDPYLRAVGLFAFGQEDGEFIAEPEEVYAETISLPSVTVRAGKFKLAMGKHNILHTHAYPFIDAPLIHEELLGGEGLNETAVSAAVLLPFSWYSEIIAQGFAPTSESLYGSPRAGDVGGLVRLKNLWDFTDDLTMELGGSGTAGKNQFDRTSSLLGLDLTFKWRPSVGGKYHALVWSTEYLNGYRPGLTDDAGESAERLGGIATWLQYQFQQRGWIQARYERVGLPRSAAIPARSKVSALAGFFPSEFSGLRLQYDRTATQGAPKADHAIAFQYNVSIGAHPAHAY